jgi:hypothetical protein
MDWTFITSLKWDLIMEATVPVAAIIIAFGDRYLVGAV